MPRGSNDPPGMEADVAAGSETRLDPLAANGFRCLLLTTCATGELYESVFRPTPSGVTTPRRHHH